MSRMLKKAGELSGGTNNPVSTDMMEIYQMLNRQARGGIETQHMGSDYYAYWGSGYKPLGRIPGGGGLADGYWHLQNRKIFIDAVEIPATASVRERARAPFTYAQRILHEVFHVAATNDLYTHEIMDQSARALYSVDFDTAIRKHCIPPDMW